MVECSVSAVTEKTVEMLCVPNIPVVRLLKEVAANETEQEEIIFAVNSRPQFQPLTLRFKVAGLTRIKHHGESIAILHLQKEKTLRLPELFVGSLKLCPLVLYYSNKKTFYCNYVFYCFCAIPQ